MDIFAGCGGLSEGFQQAQAAVCKWAIEYEYPAAEAFKLNHPEAHVMCNNCNVILTAAMHKAGLQDICKASPEVRQHYSTFNFSRGQVAYYAGGIILQPLMICDLHT